MVEIVHGHRRRINGKKWASPTYTTWLEMRRRCRDTNHKDSKRWRARGITVCDRWQSFENFLEDMGPRPRNKTLDRRDNDGPYCKENCRWATAKQQANNRGQKEEYVPSVGV